MHRDSRGGARAGEGDRVSAEWGQSVRLGRWKVLETDSGGGRMTV